MSFYLQIISPEKSVFDEEIEMVIIPGTEGDIGVLSNHMPLITSLRLGNIYVYRNKKIINQRSYCKIFFFLNSQIGLNLLKYFYCYE